MNRKITWIRLNINYLSENYPDSALETSSPIKNLEIGLSEFVKAITLEHCSDNKNLPVRAELVKYIYDPATRATQTKVIISNQESFNVLKVIQATQA